MQISKLKKTIFVLLMIASMVITYMPAFSFAAGDQAEPTQEPAVTEEIQTEGESGEPSETPPAEEPEQKDAVDPDKAASDDKKTSADDQKDDETSGTDIEKDRSDIEDGVYVVKDDPVEQDDEFGIFLDDDMTVSYKSYYRSGDSGQTTIFKVKKGKTYRGTCCVGGIPHGGSGKATLDEITNKRIKKIIYYYAVKKDWLTGDDAYDSAKNLLGLSYKTGCTKARMIECFCQIYNMGEDKWLKTITGPSMKWSATTAKAVLKYYKNIDTSDINLPSNFVLYKGKNKNSNHQDFYLWEMEDVELYMKLFKTDSTGETPLPGAVYWLYTDKACTDRAEDSDDNKVVLTTKANGYSNTVKLTEKGTYYAVEKTAPDGYSVYPDPIPVKVTAGATSSSNAAILNARDYDLDTPAIRLHKQGAREGVNLLLGGAEYEVYYDQACTDPVMKLNGSQLTLVTKDDGCSNTEMLDDLNDTAQAALLRGETVTLYARETSAPDGWEIDETPISVTVNQIA